MPVRNPPPGRIPRSRKHFHPPRIESAFDPPAIDVESLEDLYDIVHGQLVFQGPADDIKVFPSPLEVLDDRIDQGRCPKGSSQKSKVTLIELNPERPALEMLEPAMSQKATPMVADPAANGGLTEIASRLLTFDPLITLSLFLPTTMETHP
jgi:hypothetical protein